MSLVAYAASSSDEESDCDNGVEKVRAELVVTKAKRQKQEEATKPTLPINSDAAVAKGLISDDDDDDFAPVEVPLTELKQLRGSGLALPKPKNTDSGKEFEGELKANFEKLPLPKPSETLKEEDDEFLRKKEVPQDILEKEKGGKGPVKIFLTSLQEFSDVDKEIAAGKNKLKSSNPKYKNASGLLSILPQAKSERVFTKVSTAEDKQNIAKAPPFKVLPFVPDTVRTRRPALNTECVDGIKAVAGKRKVATATARPGLVEGSDSDNSEDGNRETKAHDFFSLDKEEELPEVSANEINVMVAKRAAQMAEATDKYLHAAAAKAMATSSNYEDIDSDAEDDEQRKAQMENNTKPLDADAIQALVGSRAKRRRQHQEDMNVMDLSGDQVMPNRDEWMRTALASSTTYQPTGVLVDEEPASGTRRKHQITYLAHKAKANEAELQAMWAVNRQNRRATQSKYGF